MRGQKLAATSAEKRVIARIHAMAEHSGEVYAWYLPADDSVTVRNGNPKYVPRNVPKLPENAILIGLYRQPIDGHAFVEDLRCVRLSGGTAASRSDPPA